MILLNLRKIVNLYRLEMGGKVQLIKVENLSVKYGADEEAELVTAIDDVSINIKKGDFVAVIGKNGSGKSTLAKTFNALILPNGGCVYVKGIDTKDKDRVWEIRQTCGMVFQNPDNQLVSAVVEDDVAFGPENLGIEPSAIRERVKESLKQVKMYEYRTKAPHLLSGGQKQRIAIAGVLAMKPECIILDEPTAMLDPRGRDEVLNIAKQLNDEGITVILITHFMEEAAIADKLVIMNEGSMILNGTPEEVFSNWEVVEKLGLKLPLALDFTIGLKNAGIDIDKNYLTTDSFVDFISSYYNNGVGSGLGKEDNRDRNGDNVTADNGKVEEGKYKHEYGGSDGESETGKKTADEVLLEVENLTHIYSKGLPYETKAIDNVSFSVKKGEFIGVIGHTGSGKSTLIQHLNGILKPDSGRIILSGQDLSETGIKLHEIRKRTGLVFQYPEYQLFEETVEKDVAFGPSNLGLPQEEINERVKWALDMVGISYEKFAQVSPFELSGGQKRRVAIAGVIAMKPEILILDEPTAGLDPGAHQDILDMIGDFHKSEGTSIFLVSHNMGDIAKLSDRVMVMDNGRLAMMGTPEKIFAEDKFLHGLGLGLPPETEVLLKLKNAGVPVKGRGLSLKAAVNEILEVVI